MYKVGFLFVVFAMIGCGHGMVENKQYFDLGFRTNDGYFKTMLTCSNIPDKYEPPSGGWPGYYYFKNEYKVRLPKNHYLRIAGVPIDPEIVYGEYHTYVQHRASKNLPMLVYVEAEVYWVNDDLGRGIIKSLFVPYWE